LPSVSFVQETDAPATPMPLSLSPVATRTLPIRAPLTVRIKRNVLAQGERKLLDWMCALIPRFITPDWLTAFGAAGAVIAFIGYAATVLDPSFFWMATLGIVIHWFGDSLDGSLARYRQIERPRYGYFVDFSVDAICCFLIMLGVGFSAYVRLDVALFALVGYYMLWMYVLLNCQVSRNLQLSFLAAGPTEFRIVLIGLNCWMYFAGDLTMQAGPAIVSPYDLAFCGMGIVSISLFVFNVFTVARRLRLEDALQNRGAGCES
jgi:archaetidylinositol phosphate synthase